MRVKPVAYSKHWLLSPYFRVSCFWPSWQQLQWPILRVWGLFQAFFSRWMAYPGSKEAAQSQPCQFQLCVLELGLQFYSSTTQKFSWVWFTCLAISIVLSAFDGVSLLFLVPLSETIGSYICLFMSHIFIEHLLSVNIVLNAWVMNKRKRSFFSLEEISHHRNLGTSWSPPPIIEAKRARLLISQSSLQLGPRHMT